MVTMTGAAGPSSDRCKPRLPVKGPRTERERYTESLPVLLIAVPG